ncbi:conserved uncharacterized protein [Desulfobacula toluolica Tol2]|uniref:Conserved uncharacterized protein n=1 Tax=Desulfobacula toluolica (strain DSM 7467 / Tol2) TaxID=651182 RepID=K0NLR6_DESTT|nr:conserved uncharacterized protein [Desulfobacula toluolica Tol2]
MTFGVLSLAFSPFIVFSAISLFFFEGQFIKLASSIRGGGASTIIALLFALFVFRKSRGNYGTSSKLLHQIALGNFFLGEALFDIENLLYSSRVHDVSGKKHVFVAGLARAGTTILLRKLYENGKFTSLTYRDMPFILAPNMWRSISHFSRQNTGMQERAHGDGLEIDYDSPEALEEVFWRTFCGSDYIRQDCLIPMTADLKILDKFNSFIGLILKNDTDNCYLSKNNNNILRLNSIIKAFPNALIIIPFRDPLQQAFSLLKQHKRFMQKHSEDPFTKQYMAWLAHHEFGADHRPFLFDGKKDGKSDDRKDTQNLSYWLLLWMNTYSYLMENLPSQAVFLSYESLCEDTAFVWGKISEKIDLAPYTETIFFSKSYHPINESLPRDLILESQKIYKKLMAQSIGFNGKPQVGQ